MSAEIANSIGDKTALSLRVCMLLPTQQLMCTPDALDFRLPTFTNDECTTISCRMNDELIWTAKFIKAFEDKKFEPGEHFQPEYHPVFDCTELSPADCFEVLERNCCSGEHEPSFLTLAAFTTFMNQSINRLIMYMQDFPGTSLTDGLVQVPTDARRDFGISGRIAAAETRVC